MVQKVALITAMAIPLATRCDAHIVVYGKII